MSRNPQPIVTLALLLSMALASAARAQPEADPLPDRDGDGRLDDVDKCPDEPEDDDGFQDDEGCPEYDNDGDAVPDLMDQCGEERETANGYQDDDGCPDVLPRGSPAPEPCADGKACKAAGDEAWKQGDMATAAERYRRACALGDPGGCGALAVMMERGEARALHPGHIVGLHRLACSKRVRESCHNLGLILRDGRGTPARPELAGRYFAQACDLGLPRACTLLGRPTPTPAASSPASPAPVGDCVDARTCDDASWAAFLGKRYDEAARLGQRGCDLGAPRACAMLGNLYDNGHGVAKDAVKAFALAKKACAAGEQSGCHNAAVHLAAGDVVAQDLVEARRLYDAACKTGLKPSCDALARLPKPDPLGPAIAAHEKKDYRGAAKLAKPLCDGGDLNACAWLGLSRWELGKAQEAAALWDRACRGQVAWACRELAQSTWTGEGTRKDEARAHALAKQGCELGDAGACNAAGGWSFLRNEVGVDWFTRACDLKDMEGCAFAAHSYRDGDFGPRDPSLAVKYGQRACDLGSWTECGIVATAYCDGRGTARDVPRCQRTLEAACKHGDDAACQQLHDRFD